MSFDPQLDSGLVVERAVGLLNRDRVRLADWPRAASGVGQGFAAACGPLPRARDRDGANPNETWSDFIELLLAMTLLLGSAVAIETDSG